MRISRTLIIVLLVVFGVTRGVVKEGNNFLGLLGAGKIGEAYENASPTLKAQQTEAAFEKLPVSPRARNRRN